MTKKIKRGSEATVNDVCLRNLHVTSTQEVNAWFKKSYAGLYRIDGIDEAIDLIDSRKWDLIRVIGDYDVDGATSTAQARLALTALGYPVDDRIPKRFTEGFGLNPVIVQEVPELENVLLITIDNGIAAIDAIKLAKERGFAVIVVDHHLPVMEDGKAVLPEADVIIDPHAIPGSADFDEYCGAGLAYRLFSRLIGRHAMHANDEEKKQFAKLTAILEPLAMMGTIADVAQLREENYVIARNGLKKLERRCATPGMLALHDKLWVSHPVASDIGFKSGPCINANSRLFDDGAKDSVDLLACMDYREAMTMADKAIEHNNERKRQVETGMGLAEQYVAANGYTNDLPLVVYLKGVNEGIIGIIAGRLQEKYGTVALVFTDSETEGVLKGSGRSTEDINLKEMLDAFGDMFVKYGGHAGAAGMSIETTKLDAFRTAANKWAKQNGLEHDAKDTLLYDLEIRADEVPQMLDTALQYGPFGEGNPAPVFKVTGFRPNLMNGKRVNVVGKDGAKLESDTCQAIGFGLAGAMCSCSAETFTLYGTLSYNYFKDSATPQIEIADFDEETTPQKAETPLMRLLRDAAANK